MNAPAWPRIASTLVMLFAPLAARAQQPARPAATVRAASGSTHGGALTVDATRRRASLTLRAGLGGVRQPELNFNGTSMGELELRVPVGWTVELHVTNVGQAPHSARVVADRAIAPEVGAAAIAGAETPRAALGLAPGTSHTVTFLASKPGRYRITCAVPAHGYTGMWIRLDVSTAATSASLVERAPDEGDDAR